MRKYYFFKKSARHTYSQNKPASQRQASYHATSVGAATEAAASDNQKGDAGSTIRVNEPLLLAAWGLIAKI